MTLGPDERLVKQPENRVVKPFLAATRFFLFLRQIALANFLSKNLSKIIFVEQVHAKTGRSIEAMACFILDAFHLKVLSDSPTKPYNILQEQ